MGLCCPRPKKEIEHQPLIRQAQTQVKFTRGKRKKNEPKTHKLKQKLGLTLQTETKRDKLAFDLATPHFSKGEKEFILGPRAVTLCDVQIQNARPNEPPIRTLCLFGEQHKVKFSAGVVETKNNTCSMASWIEDYIHSNPGARFDVFFELPFLQEPMDINKLASHGTLRQLRKKFWTCLDLNKEECPFSNNARMHNTDVRFRRKMLYAMFVHVFWETIQKQLTSEIKHNKAQIAKLQQMRTFVSDHWQQDVVTLQAELVAIQSDPPKDKRLSEVFHYAFDVYAKDVGYLQDAYNKSDRDLDDVTMYHDAKNLIDNSMDMKAAMDRYHTAQKSLRIHKQGRFVSSPLKEEIETYFEKFAQNIWDTAQDTDKQVGLSFLERAMNIKWFYKELGVALMDAYLVLRLFRSFDDSDSELQYVHNAIFYGGDYHRRDIINCLQACPSLSVTITKQYTASRFLLSSNCLHVTDFDAWKVVRVKREENPKEEEKQKEQKPEKTLFENNMHDQRILGVSKLFFLKTRPDQYVYILASKATDTDFGSPSPLDVSAENWINQHDPKAFTHIFLGDTMTRAQDIIGPTWQLEQDTDKNLTKSWSTWLTDLDKARDLIDPVTSKHIHQTSHDLTENVPGPRDTSEETIDMWKQETYKLFMVRSVIRYIYQTKDYIHNIMIHTDLQCVENLWNGLDKMGSLRTLAILPITTDDDQSVFSKPFDYKFGIPNTLWVMPEILRDEMGLSFQYMSK